MRTQLAGLARKEGVPLHAVERDYIQHLFLRRLDQEHLIFKGGTCLRIAHGAPRYSEDLDFSASGGEAEIDRTFTAAASSLRDYGVAAEVSSRPGGRWGLHRRLRFSGPLFDGSDRSRGSVRLEVSTRREEIESETVFVPRTPYADVPQLTLRALSLPHLLAEKTRALAVRGKPRDLFDVDWLLLRGARCTRRLLDLKMSIYGRRFTLRELSTGTVKAVRGWDRDLGALLGQMPPVADARRRVARGIREMLRAGSGKRG